MKKINFNLLTKKIVKEKTGSSIELPVVSSKEDLEELTLEKNQCILNFIFKERNDYFISVISTDILIKDESFDKVFINSLYTTKVYKLERIKEKTSITEKEKITFENKFINIRNEIEFLFNTKNEFEYKRNVYYNLLSIIEEVSLLLTSNYVEIDTGKWHLFPILEGENVTLWRNPKNELYLSYKIKGYNKPTLYQIKESDKIFSILSYLCEINSSLSITTLKDNDIILVNDEKYIYIFPNENFVKKLMDKITGECFSPTIIGLNSHSFILMNEVHEYILNFDSLLNQAIEKLKYHLYSNIFYEYLKDESNVYCLFGKHADEIVIEDKELLKLVGLKEPCDIGVYGNYYHHLDSFRNELDDEAREKIINKIRDIILEHTIKEGE